MDEKRGGTARAERAANGAASAGGGCGRAGAVPHSVRGISSPVRGVQQPGLPLRAERGGLPRSDPRGRGLCRNAGRADRGRTAPCRRGGRHGDSGALRAARDAAHGHRAGGAAARGGPLPRGALPRQGDLRRGRGHRPAAQDGLPAPAAPGAPLRPRDPGHDGEDRGLHGDHRAGAPETGDAGRGGLLDRGGPGIRPLPPALGGRGAGGPADDLGLLQGLRLWQALHRRAADGLCDPRAGV